MIVMLLFVFSIHLKSQHVNSIGEIESTIIGSENKEVFNEEMEGGECSDKLDVILPEGLQRTEIYNLLKEDLVYWDAKLYGFKKWPYKKDSYIALAKFSDEDNYYQKLYLAVLSYDGNELKKMAGGPCPEQDNVNTKVYWNHSNCNGPIDAYDEEGGLYPMEYKKFDFAKYKISDHEVAFGVRCNWFEGYAGGGAFYQALLLFVQKGDEIINVLAEPMAYFQDFAGDWNEDGTRQHDIQQVENILIMLPHKTNGYYDIKLKEVNGGWNCVFVWDELKNRYLPLK